MIISDKTILQINGLIDPFNMDNLQPASYDLTLGSFKTEKFEVEPVNYLYPGEFALACTKETVKIPNNLVGIVAGKSSLARMGLAIHDAGFIDPGFNGQIVLELYNKSDKPIMLTNGMRICQIYFVKTDVPVENSYNGHYQNQEGVTRSWLEDN